jgi:hypothetical protein
LYAAMASLHLSCATMASLWVSSGEPSSTGGGKAVAAGVKRGRKRGAAGWRRRGAWLRRT